MAQLHRYPRRPRDRHAQLWRPARLHLGLPLHRRCHGNHGVCARDVPLARKIDTNEGPGRLRRPLRSDLSGHHPAPRRGGQLCPEDHVYFAAALGG